MAADGDSYHSTAQSRLRDPGLLQFHPEEDRRPWSAISLLHSNGQLANPFAEYSGIDSKLRDKPMLRVWDTFSGSIPGSSAGNRMLARSKREVLATRDQRASSLELHADHAKRLPTPYISFTASPTAAEDLIKHRTHKTKRGDQNLVAIDPKYRLQHGLPILDMGEEMIVYGIDDPYPHGPNYFIDHYICLWEVTPREVVGVWSWHDLREDNDWYENIIMPAFREYRAR